MFDWVRRIFIADVGRWHARRNYPSEEDFIAIPLYPSGVGQTAAPASDAQPRQDPAGVPANDPHEPARKLEA